MREYPPRKIYESIGVILMDKYFEYIHSPQWQARSAECIRKAGYKCKKCGSMFGLQTHHKQYANLGNEKDEDLRVLCKSCHKEIHAQKQENKKK
jgi:5-methylcytosine-specific restriction endonuclease McrA